MKFKYDIGYLWRSHAEDPVEKIWWNRSDGMADPPERIVHFSCTWLSTLDPIHLCVNLIQIRTLASCCTELFLKILNLFFLFKFLLLSLLPLLSPSPSHVLGVLHILRAIFIRFECLLLSGSRILNLEKWSRGPKLHVATYRFKSVDSAQHLSPKEKFMDFQTSSSLLQTFSRWR